MAGFPMRTVLGLLLLAGGLCGARPAPFRPQAIPGPDGWSDATSPDEWGVRRRMILEAFQSVAGRLPEGPEGPPAFRILRESRIAGRFRRLIEYESCPGSFTPAWLTIPEEALAGSPAPAILCLHPTDAQAGHDVVVGLKGDPGRAYADELAALGFVTIAPAYPLLANYHPDLAATGFRSGTMRAIFDNRRALDLLESGEFAFVRPGKRGAIGHSLGGHNALFTALFDERISCVVTSCGFDSLPDYYGGDPANWAPGLGWCQTRYMPRLAEYQGRLSEIPFDFPEVLAALAPRHVFVSAPLHDANFRAESVRRVTAAARQVFALHGAEERLVVRHPDCGHEFPDAVRHEAYQVLARAVGEPPDRNHGKSIRPD